MSIKMNRVDEVLELAFSRDRRPELVLEGMRIQLLEELNKNQDQKAAVLELAKSAEDVLRRQDRLMEIARVLLGDLEAMADAMSIDMNRIFELREEYDKMKGNS